VILVFKSTWADFLVSGFSFDDNLTVNQSGAGCGTRGGVEVSSKGPSERSAKVADMVMIRSIMEEQVTMDSLNSVAHGPLQSAPNPIAKIDHNH
jgi:hypothetical protein